MTYRELSKELGISASKLQMIESEVLKEKGPAALLGNFDDAKVRVIRVHCLFSMLGVPDDEAIAILKHEMDMRATLKKHVDSILSDDSNHSQAAIVMQNIRRECQDVDELDPVPFLQHIKELKHSGGLFYDVNSGRLEDEGNRKNAFGVSGTRQSQKSGIGGFFNEFVSKDRDPDRSEKQDSGRENNSEEQPNQDSELTENENNTGNGQESPLKTENSDTKTVYDSTESTAKSSAGYDENWSPYTDRGFGASNMGSGNWQGWSAGYGSYAKPIGARERINNGEKTCPHPFRRFAARILDTTLMTLIGGAILRLGFRVNVGISLKMVAYCEIIFWLFEMMIEPLLLTTFGTTPGKFIMGIKIRDMKTKNKLDLKQGYIRALKLAWQGFGFMIPIYTVFKRAMSFLRCRMDDTMPWDNGIDVELVDESPARIALVIIAVVLLNVGDELVSKQALIPENRGQITSEQFYENVVELMKYNGYVGDIPDFKLDIKSGYVKSVSLTYTSDQTDKNRYDEMYLGFLAFAGASEESNGLKLMTTSALGLLKSYYTNFTGSYGGVNLINTSDSEINDAGSYSLLYSMLYGSEATIPAFNQTFTMTR